MMATVAFALDLFFRAMVWATSFPELNERISMFVDPEAFDHRRFQNLLLSK